MSRYRRLLIAATVCVATLATPQPAGAVGDLTCGGMVFDDRDADGARIEALDQDQVLDDGEPGIADIDLTVTDVTGRVRRATTGFDGRWRIDVTNSTFPVRIEFDLPDGYLAGRPGPDAGRAVQVVPSPAACREAAIGGLGIYDQGTFCAEQPEIAVTCFVTADHDMHDDEPAIVALSNAAVDNEATDAQIIDDWLKPAPRPIATVGEVGAVYGLAASVDGTIYAAGFTKRHTRSVGELNPSGNPTVIYRIPSGSRPEVLTFVDPDAPNPHGPAPVDRDADRDLESMDAVFTSGLGDLELSADGRTLYTVDLGRRELVTISTGSGRITSRIPLDGKALNRSDCNTSSTNPFGDLRGFGLGWRDDDTLFVGVVCSAASSADLDRPVREGGAPGPGLGDPRQLIGYVYEFTDGLFTERLWWSLPVDRGDTHENGLISNDAVWHPWTPTYPYDDEHDVVSYPQPAVTDIALDRRGNLLIAVGDRWSHQTAPETFAPGRDGRVRRITETIAAGDLVRACRLSDGWTIEGTGGCAGGFGNGWEFFDGDSYGWHAETVLGSVLRLPGRDDIVVTQMNPVTADHTWRSGGLAWHDSRTGDSIKGARLYDGRSADPDHTFEKASGLGDLAALCGGPPPQIGGAVWHDVDADGVWDPADPAIPDVRIELRDETGVVIAVDETTVDGLYEFDEDNVTGGLEAGATYRVVVAEENYDPGDGVLAGRGPFTGLVPTDADVGIRDDLDSDVRVTDADAIVGDLPTSRVVAGDDPTTADREPAISTFNDMGLRDQYDLSVSTDQGPRTLEDGLVSFRISVANEGSVPSGPFQLRASLPVETSLISTAPYENLDATFGAGTVTWSFDDGQSIPPGADLSFEMTLRVNDPTIGAVTNVVEIVADSGDDHDSTPDGGTGADDDDDELRIALFGFGGRIWADSVDDGDATPDTRQPIADVLVHVLDENGNQLGTTSTDDSGRFLFDSFPAGTYIVAVPASEFDSGRSLHRFDRVDAVELSDGAVRADGDVRSAPFELGPRSDDDLVEIEIGFAAQPPRRLIDVVVPYVLMPTVVVFAALLLIERRRRVGGVIGAN